MEIIFAFVGFAFACIGLFFAGSALLNIARSIAARSWRPVPGKILTSDVSTNLTQSSSPVGAGYDPKITYEYEVGGISYTGTNLNFSRFRTNSPSQASRTVRKYPTGAAVTIYYNPMNPERAVLEPGKIAPHISGLILGIALALFGTFFGFGGWLGFDVLLKRVGDLAGIDQAFIWRYLPPSIIVLGAGIIVAGLLAGQRSHRSRKWPTTEGTVIASGIVRESSSSSSSTISTNQSVYKPEVAYEYEINGERYVSNKIELLDISTNNRGRAESIQRRYTVGDTVRVHVDPNNPERAVLQPGGKSGSCLLIVVGSGFVIIAFIMMWFYSIIAQ